MKVIESGMPDEIMWNSFFDVPCILHELFINSNIQNLVEIGCGYGTFTFEAAKVCKQVFAIDFEQAMVDYVDTKCKENNIINVNTIKTDVLEQGTSLPNESVDYVMLFNILHHSKPEDFFKEVYRILKPKGLIGIIHWRSDLETPRGPSLDIRPTPRQVKNMIDLKKFEIVKDTFILPPYHFGMLVKKSL